MGRPIQQELKRCTVEVKVFPGKNSILHLVSAVHLEIDEKWASGKMACILAMPPLQDRTTRGYCRVHASTADLRPSRSASLANSRRLRGEIQPHTTLRTPHPPTASGNTSSVVVSVVIDIVNQTLGTLKTANYLENVGSNKSLACKAASMRASSNLA